MKKLVNAFKMMAVATFLISNASAQTWEWASTAGSTNINTKADRVTG